MNGDDTPYLWTLAALSREERRSAFIWYRHICMHVLYLCEHNLHTPSCTSHKKLMYVHKSRCSARAYDYSECLTIIISHILLLIPATHPWIKGAWGWEADIKNRGRGGPRAGPRLGCRGLHRSSYRFCFSISHSLAISCQFFFFISQANQFIYWAILLPTT